MSEGGDRSPPSRHQSSPRLIERSPQVVGDELERGVTSPEVASSPPPEHEHDGDAFDDHTFGGGAGLAPSEDQSPPPPTRARSSSVTEEDDGGDGPPAPTRAPTRQRQPSVPVVDLRTWLRAVGLEGHTRAIAAALRVVPDGEPITSELKAQADAALDAAALTANLRLFERKRFVNAVANCRNDQPAGAAFPPATEKQSVRGVLKRAKVSEYEGMLGSKGLGWGDLSWVTANDLEEAGLKYGHARRLVRIINKEVKFRAVDEEGVPPVAPAPAPWLPAEDDDENDVPLTRTQPAMPGAVQWPEPDQECTTWLEPEPEPEPPSDGTILLEPEPEPEPEPEVEDLAARLKTASGFKVEPEELKPEDLEMTEDLLGEGQYGKVYAGVLLSHGKRESVAVKMMGKVDSAEVADYEKEIFNLQKVSSTCSKVCRLYGTCVKDGKHCIVMKRYRSSLAVLLKGQPGQKLSVERTMNYAVQISQALIELHDNKVIMMDLKPDNVLIDEHREAYLADFGISKVMNNTASIQRSTSTKGTFRYMSPESYDPDQPQAYQSDMWSLGCTLVELLTGKAPWTKLADYQIMHQVSAKKTPELPDDGHPGLCSLIQRCFSYDPQDRPTSAVFYAEAMQLQLSEAPGARMPFTDKEKQLLRWIQEDTISGDVVVSEEEAVEMAAEKLQVDSSILERTNSEVLKHLERAIIKTTMELEQDESNEFRRGMFLSHAQATAGDEVMLLMALIEKACPALQGKLWFDKDQNPTIEEMRLGVKHCTYFVLYLSKGVLLRPFVRKEIRWAIQYRKKIRLVWPQEGEHAVTRFNDFFDDCRQPVDIAGSDGTDENELDISKIFNNNVAISYYTSDEMFQNASVAILLKQCEFCDDAAKLQKHKAVTLPEGIKVQLQYNMSNGRAHAQFVHIELEKMHPALSGNCSRDVKKQLDTKHGHLVIFVTKDVFAQATVIEAVQQAQKFNRPITCLVETRTDFGGFQSDKSDMLPAEAVINAPADIVARDGALLACKVVPFYTVRDFRDISLQAVILSMQAHGEQLTRERSPDIHGGNATNFDVEIEVESASLQGGYKTCLDRQFVQLEVGQALDQGKNIITVFEDDRRMAGFFDYDLAKDKYKDTRWEELLHIDATVYRRDKWEANAMIHKIIDKGAGHTCTAKQNPINEPGIWDFFLCHAQGAGSDQVKIIAEKLRQEGKTVWLDVDMQDRSTEAMMEGVAHCKSLVVFLTGSLPFATPTSPKRTAAASSNALVEWQAKYEQQEELGTGKLSTVYRALDKRLHRVVAIKVFRPPSAGSTFDEPQARALERASVIGRILTHVNIAACYDYVLSPTTSEFFQALELCDGPTLQQLLDTEGPMREASAVAYLSAVCDGLHAIHSKDLVHQYITLSNIRLSDDVPKILNFALARATSTSASGEAEVELGTLMLTDTAEVAGNPDYKSPEAWRGDGNVDSRTDIWSVGVCLFVLLTGEMPFTVPAGMTDKKHLVGEVLYKMDPAPDMRDIITKVHEQEVDSRRPWQVSDATAAVVAACLEKEVLSRPRRAVVLKTELDEAISEGGATEYDIVLSYSQPDEAAARRIHALLQDARPIGPNNERLVVHLADASSDIDDSLGRSTCFVPVISADTLQSMATQTSSDAASHIMLARCQLATALCKLGLVEIVPVLFGEDSSGEEFHIPGSDGSGGPNPRATRTAVAEMISSLTRSGCLRATNLPIGEVNFHKTMSRVLASSAAIKMCDEKSDDACVEKLASRVESTKKVAAARKHRGLHSSMVVGVASGGDQAESADFDTAAGEFDLYSDDSEPAAPSIPVVPDDIRNRVNYTDTSVRSQLKDYSWYTKDVAIALKMLPGVTRDLARAKVVYHTRSEPALKCLVVAVERLLAGLSTDLHSIVAGLDEPAIALLIDILDMAALPLSQIESAQIHRSLDRYETLFDERDKTFYVIALLARTSDTTMDSFLESSARAFVLDTFVPFLESQHFQVRSGIQAIFAGLHDVEAIIRGANEKSAKLLTLLLELVDVVGIEYKVPVQQSVADSPLFVLIPYLAQPGEEQWRLQMQTQLEKVLHDDPSLVQVAKNCWSGTRTATSADDRYEVAIARQMSLGPQALATAAERLILLLEVQCSECSTAAGATPGEVSSAVVDLMESRKAEFRRIAQLAVPAVADATEPRFCVGGYQSERQHAVTKILEPLEEAGWRLVTPMRLLWAGTRDLDELAKDCDANTRALISKILDTVVERPPDRTKPDEALWQVEDMQPNVQEALGKMLVELQVAARLAVEPNSADRDRGRTRLLQHVTKRFEAQQVRLHTPISRIFDGATDAQSLCAGLDHIDAAAVRKILSFVSNREECLSPSWPRWEALFGAESEPNQQTKDLIARREVEWKRIAQLAVPAVARASYPRFCSGGIEVEKDTVMMELIDDLERRGWCIRDGIKRIWAGERDIATVALEADIQDTHILRHVLSLIVDSPDKVVRSAERQRQARRALAECDNTLRVAAKLATAPHSYERQGERDRLMAHIYGALESRGLELADPISRILVGERDESSLTEDLDDIDGECTQKCLEYVRMIEENGVSTDLWPTVHMLSQAPPNTQAFLDKHSRDGDFDRIVRAKTPSDQRAVTSQLLDRWEQGGWEVRMPVQRMWEGERREHVAVGTSDRNSAHIVRRLLSMFEATDRGEPTTGGGGRGSTGGSDQTTGSTDYSTGSDFGPMPGTLDRSSISEADVQNVMLFTSCTAAQARTCLEAVGGNVEQAAAMAFDAVDQAQAADSAVAQAQATRSADRRKM